MADLNSFLEYLNSEKKCSAHTVRAYKDDLSAFNNFIDAHYEGLDLIDLNYQEVRSYIVELNNQGLSNKSINRKLSSIRSFYKFCMKTHQIKISPLNDLKSLKTPKNLSTPFSIKEVKEVIDNISVVNFKTARQKLIVELLYATGMRRAELINLKTNDLDWSQKQLKITGKRNKQRIVPLFDRILNTLDTYLAYKKELDLQEELLFVTEKNKALDPGLVYKIVNDLFAQSTNKSKTSPHILRHSFATHLLNQGSDLNAVKELLGHESLSSTEIYTHNSIAQLKKSYHKNHPRTRD